jgi:hypothetical protein
MAKRIVIAELEMDTKRMQKDNASLIKQINILKESQKQLKKETSNLTTATDEQAMKFAKSDAELKKLSGTYNTNKKTLAENTTGVKNLNNELSREVLNIASAREQNKKLLAVRNQLNPANDKHKSAITEINDKMDKNNKYIESNVSGLEQQKIGIGKYEEGVISALKKVNIMGVNLGDVTQKGMAHRDSLKAQTVAQNTSTKSVGAGSKALKIFKYALIATGIGAIVVLIGSLVAGFASTQSGIDKVNRALAPLKGAFQGIIGVVQKLAVNVFGQLKDRWTVTLNSLLIGITKLRIKWNEFTGDDSEAKSLKAYQDQLEKELIPAQERLLAKNKELSQIWSNASNDIKEAAKAQQEIQRISEAVEQKEAEIVLIRAKSLDLIKEQELIAKDTTKTTNERKAAADEALRISRELATSEKEILLLKIQSEELQQSQNDSGRKDLQALNELKAELINKDKEQKATELKFISAKSAYQKEQNALAKKAIDNALKESTQRLDLFIAENQSKSKTLSEQLKFETTIKDKRLKLLEEELKAKKISQTKYETEVLNIKKDFLGKQAELAIQNLDRELQNDKALLDNKLLTEQLSNEQIYQARLTGLDAINAIELEKLQEQFEAKILSQEEFNTAKLEKDNEYLVAKKELEDENRAIRDEEELAREEARKEQEAIDFENDMALASENYLAQLILKQEDLNKQKALELANAEKVGADKSKIEAKYAKVEKNIQKSKQDFILGIASQTFGNLASLLGEHTAAGKAAAIAETTIATYQAATKAYSALSGITIVGPVLGAIAAAAAVASGIANVKKITSTKVPKAEKGALFNIGGKRHSQGGTRFTGEDGTAFEAEQGEVIGVMNRNAARLFMEFNDKYRDGGIVQRSNVFASGGVVQRSVINNNNGASSEQMKEAFSEALQEMPSPIVAVTDINDGQTSYSEVVDGANIS